MKEVALRCLIDVAGKQRSQVAGKIYLRTVVALTGMLEETALKPAPVCRERHPACCAGRFSSEVKSEAEFVSAGLGEKLLISDVARIR